LRAVVKSGFESQEKLPEIPVAPEPVVAAPVEGRGRRGGRRRRKK
jgi:hypothetical protein